MFALTNNTLFTHFCIFWNRYNSLMASVKPDNARWSHRVSECAWSYWWWNFWSWDHLPQLLDCEGLWGVSVAGLKQFCCIWHLFFIAAVPQKEFYKFFPPSVVLHLCLSRHSLHRKVSGNLQLCLVPCTEWRIIWEVDTTVGRKGKTWVLKKKLDLLWWHGSEKTGFQRLWTVNYCRLLLPKDAFTIFPGQ